jgi:lambda repressor-like predicted transcriptional regulator
VDKNGTIELPELTAASLPDWLPAAVRHYLDHTEEGTSLRELARREGLHASTILRQVRRFENRREDPLMDEALSAVSRLVPRQSDAPARKDDPLMSVHTRLTGPGDAPEICDEQALQREGMRVLRRLAEPNAFMAIAPDLEKAVVIRELPDGKSLRTAVLERSVAHAFALKDWVTCRKSGRVSTYEITSAGRAALKRMVDDEDRRCQGMAEAATPGIILLRARWRFWAAGETGMESPSSNPNLSPPPNACARISRLPRWAPASRRTGTGF